VASGSFGARSEGALAQDPGTPDDVSRDRRMES